MTMQAVEDIERLSEFYEAGYHDAFLDNAVRKIIERQIARDEADLAGIEHDLAEYEARYGMTSDDFWRQYQAGQLEDSAEFMEWSVFCKMRQRLIAHLQILRGDTTRG